jgi:CBS domain containing-hemolysin-like protein
MFGIGQSLQTLVSVPLVISVCHMALTFSNVVPSTDVSSAWTLRLYTLFMVFFMQVMRCELVYKTSAMTLALRKSKS